MKKLRLTFLFGVLCALFVVLAACGKYDLSVPRRLYVDSDELVLHWDECNGADRYIVSVNGTEEETNKNEYSLVNLAAGEYELKVKAHDKDGTYDDSEWSDTLHFTREEETGLRYRLTSDKTAYEVYGFGSSDADATIDDTYRGKPVTKIAEKAFAGETRLKSITMGRNVREIGNRAFYMCRNLELVTFTDKVTSIGANAFQSCSKMVGIELPEGLSVLSADTFSFCTSLEEVVFPSTLLMVSENAFKNCTSLLSVELPDSAVLIGNTAFIGCTSLQSVDLGGVLSIGENAFDGNEQLREVDFSRVQTIGKYAFNGCVALTEAELPDTATSIGEGAFFDCTALSMARIGKNVSSIGAFAYYNTALWNAAEDLVYADKWCVGYKTEAAIEELRVTAPTGTTTKKYAVWREDTEGIAEQTFMNYVKNASGGFTVSGNTTLTSVQFPDRLKRVGKNAFRASADLRQVQIGIGLLDIGNYAFAYCEKLQSVIMPVDGASLKTIGNFAFMGSTKLEKITNGLPESLQEIGTQAFSGTTLWDKNQSGGVVYVENWAVGFDDSVKEVTLADGTVGIGKYAFYQSEKLEEIAFPSTLKRVNLGAFYQCDALWSADFSACRNFETLGTHVFYQCGALQSVVLPGKLKDLGASVFSGCSALSEISVGSLNNALPVTLETVGDYAFSNCSALTALQLPETLISIGNYAFQGTSLQSVAFGANLTSIGDRAYRNISTLEEVSFEDCANLTSIGSRAFYNCTGLYEIVLPDCLVTVGDYAFYGAKGVRRISLNEGLEEIGRYAFFGCERVQTVSFPETLLSIGEHAFRGCTALKSVMLPSNVETIGKHAFFSCKNLTFYAEEYEEGTGYASLWNSSYRPIVWGCSFAYDKTYVASFTKGEDSFSNVTKTTAVGEPSRDGYRFVGWTSVENGTTAEYTAEDLASVADGTTLYSVWEELTEENKTYSVTGASVDWNGKKTSFLKKVSMTEEDFDAALAASTCSLTFGDDGTVSVSYTFAEKQEEITLYYNVERGVLTLYATEKDKNDGKQYTASGFFASSFAFSDDLSSVTIRYYDSATKVTFTAVCAQN